VEKVQKTGVNMDIIKLLYQKSSVNGIFKWAEVDFPIGRVGTCRGQQIM